MRANQYKFVKDTAVESSLRPLGHCHTEGEAEGDVPELEDPSHCQEGPGVVSQRRHPPPYQPTVSSRSADEREKGPSRASEGHPGGTRGRGRRTSEGVTVDPVSVTKED